jgi:catechol 2,3-dioxygenase-like lactoylglutathione lyase family enzyme
MRFDRFATALLCDDVAASSRFYAEHFGFRVVVDLGWYASLHHDEHPAYVLDFVQRDHPSVPKDFRGRRAAGVTFGFVVEDAAAEEARLRAKGVGIVEPLRDEPWGQRHFYVAGPEGALVDVVQFVAPDPAWLAEQEARHGQAG